MNRTFTEADSGIARRAPRKPPRRRDQKKIEKIRNRIEEMRKKERVKQTKSNDTIEIYVDGACSGNPGPGGWGAYLKYGLITKEVFGYELASTNNRMEIKAAIEALKLLKIKTKIIIYTDSIYLKNGIFTFPQL